MTTDESIKAALLIEKTQLSHHLREVDYHETGITSNQVNSAFDNIDNTQVKNEEWMTNFTDDQFHCSCEKQNEGIDNVEHRPHFSNYGIDLDKNMK